MQEIPTCCGHVVLGDGSPVPGNLGVIVFAFKMRSRNHVGSDDHPIEIARE
jgi:hypothetical protein